MEMVRLEYQLENWRDSYFRGEAGSELGYPRKCMLAVSGSAGAIDAFDIECDKVDIACAETMDALIDSLPSNQRCAVHHKWLNAVYSLRDMEGSYLDALENLMLMADRRGLV